VSSWTPTLTFEERLKQVFIPPRLYSWILYRKGLARGERELHLVPHLAQRHRVSIDVGAHKGLYTYAMARCSAHVHAFEPNPKLFAILRRGAAANVTAHNLALADRTAEAELRIPVSGSRVSNQRGSLSAVAVPDHFRSLAVRASRLDDLGIADVGFIKIDVEGAERLVLAGGRDMLRRDRPNLLIEIEERHTKAPLPEIVGEIAEFGYDCYALRDGALTQFARIDLDRHHRRCTTRADYIFNFIFLPRA